MIEQSYYELPDILRVESSTRCLYPFPEGFRMCITGGREIDDLGYVWSYLDTMHNLPADLGGRGPIAELGFGCARGVDRLAWQWAQHNGVPWRRYVADWDRFGEAAGTMRNGVMLVDFKPNLLGVYDGNTGTTNCAKQARKLGIERDFYTRDLDPFDDAARWG